MPFTNFPNGITVFGIPVIPDQVSFGYNAKVFFVDGTNGSDGNPGQNVNQPLKTIQKAINLCNSAGCTIFVSPGTYEENLTIDGKDYITIEGMVIPGYAKPDIAPTTGSALVITESQGTVIKHCRFTTDADADVVSNDGNGFLFVDCVFDGSAQTGNNGLLRLCGNAADDSYTASEGNILNCYFRGSGAAGLIFQHAANPSGVGTSDNIVSGCRFSGNTGADIVSQVNTSGGGAGIFTNLTITGNQFITSEKAAYLDMDQGAAGDLAANSAIISNNYFADEALIASQIDISGQPKVHFCGNYDDAGIVNGSTFNN